MLALKGKSVALGVPVSHTHKPSFLLGVGEHVCMYLLLRRHHKLMLAIRFSFLVGYLAALK